MSVPELKPDLSIRRMIPDIHYVLVTMCSLPIICRKLVGLLGVEVEREMVVIGKYGPSFESPPNCFAAGKVAVPIKIEAIC